MKILTGILIFLTVLLALAVTFVMYSCLIVAGREDEYMEKNIEE